MGLFDSFKNIFTPKEVPTPVSIPVSVKPVEQSKPIVKHDPVDARFEGYKEGYLKRWAACEIVDVHKHETDVAADTIIKNMTRYETVGKVLGIPPYFIGLIHGLECSFRFDQHLHNGDPLKARTVQVPKGRPIVGKPPFSWEDSARDALTYQGFARLNEWDVAHVLYRLEKYNGLGSRGHGVPTAYLWSFTNQYTKGKYVRDGIWDPGAVSKQVGAAAILKALIDKGIAIE